VLQHAVAPLGYRSALVLDGRIPLSLGENLWELARLIRRHEFWALSAGLLLAVQGWRRFSGLRTPSVEHGRLGWLTALLLYLTACQFVMFSWNWKWIGLYFLPFAPLLAVLLGVGFERLLTATRRSSLPRRVLVVALLCCLAPPLYFVRNQLLPVGEVRAKRPLARSYEAAAHLKHLVPHDAKVFFYGWNVSYYLSGLPKTYLQLAYSDSTLPAVRIDDFTLRKSGFVSLSEIAVWLSTDADFAVVDPFYLSVHADDFLGAPRFMKALLDRHFVKIASVTEYPYASYDVYRRKPRGGLVGAACVSNVNPTSDHLSLLRHADVMIGNSSSGLIEAPSFGLPVVNVGARQRGHLRGANVIDVEPSREEILRGIETAQAPAFRARAAANPYGDGRAAPRIVDVLRTVPLDARLAQKRFSE